MSNNIRNFFQNSTIKRSDSKGNTPIVTPDQSKPKTENRSARSQKRSQSKPKTEEKKEKKSNKKNTKQSDSSEEVINPPKKQKVATKQQTPVKKKEEHKAQQKSDVVMEESNLKQKSNKKGRQQSKTPIQKKKQQIPAKKTGKKFKEDDDYDEESSDSDYQEEVFEEEEEDQGIVRRKRGAILESDDAEIETKKQTRMNKKRKTVKDDDESEEEEFEVKRKPRQKYIDDEDSEEEEEKEQQQKPKQETKKSQMDEYLEKMAFSKKSGMSPQFSKLQIEEHSETMNGSQSQKPSKGAKTKQPVKAQPPPKSSNRPTRSTVKVIDEDMEMKEEEKDAGGINQCLEGLTFVISGEFESISRPRMEAFIKEHSGRLTSAVSGKTDYLIVGYKLEDGREVNQGSKYQKASTLGKTILTEREFEQFIRKKTGNEEFTLSTRKSLIEQAQAPVELNRKSLQTVEMAHEMWTDLYKPLNIPDLVGNEGVVDQLYEWLKDWDDVNIRGIKKQVFFRPGQSWQNIPNVNAKAALLSGPPGIGKTSAARIVCQELGYEVLETNASDTRNKNSIQNMLQVLSTNQSLDYFSVAGLKKQSLFTNPLANEQGQQSKKSVIIMDEVDGVGAGDRGGLAALIQIIKVTRTPIICICNDRMNRKLQSLLNYVYDLKFQRPSKEAIIRRIGMICKDQGLNLDQDTLDKIVESSGNDIRQIVNILQMWKNQDLDRQFLKNISKDELVMINNFDAAHRLLNHGQKSLNVNYPSFRQKVDLFFIDYDLIPLLVQENYLTAMGDRKSLEDIEKMADAAEYISLGESVSKQLRSNQDWSLLPNLGFASAIAPCLIIEGATFYPRFPEWLGKNSSQRKSKRLIRELKKVMGHHAQASRMEIQNEYVQLLLATIYKYLKKGKDHVQKALDFMNDLGLTNEHLKEHLMSLCMDKKIVENFEILDSQVKGAFTRIYNKYHKDEMVGKKGGGKKGAKTAKTANEEEEDDAGASQLLDEEQLNEIKKGKKLEQMDEEKGKIEKTDKFEILKVKEKQKPGKGKAKPRAASGGAKTQGKGKKAARKSGGKKKESEEDEDEEMASDDSLNDFIADDDDEIEYDKKKKRPKTTAKKGRGKK